VQDSHSNAFTRDLSGSREKEVGVGLMRSMSACLKPFQHNVGVKETDKHS